MATYSLPFSFILLFLAVANAQECGETDCTRLCVPVNWQRDLCNFYARLYEWRSTAVQCGLAVPAISRDTFLPAEDQWREAREQWNAVRRVWEAEVLDGGTTDNDKDTDSLPLNEVWQTELNEWVDSYNYWKERANELLRDAVLDIVDEYPISGPPYSPDWLVVINDWNQDFNYYNTTHYDTC